MAIEEAREVAEMNQRLHEQLLKRKVRFYFKKIDGSIRIAYGTLMHDSIPPIKGTGRPLNFDLQIYYDLEKESFRSFKKSNLLNYD